ncbi:MAG: hypothetical protein ACYC91_03895 [Solirubrobacteraceae bacterium]
MESEDGFLALAAQLGAEPSATLRMLSPEQLQDLADAVHSARRRQAAELATASDQAFRYVPRLLRGPIRRALA